MDDRTRRALERDSLGPEERARYLRERIRAGLLHPRVLELAAALGDEGASIAEGGATRVWEPRLEGERVQWEFEALAVGGGPTLARAGVVAAHYAMLASNRLEHALGRRAFGLGRALLDSPDPARVPLLQQVRKQLMDLATECNRRDRGDSDDRTARAARAAGGHGHGYRPSTEERVYDAGGAATWLVMKVVQQEAVQADSLERCLNQLVEAGLSLEQIVAPIRTHLLAWCLRPQSPTTELAARVWRGDLRAERVLLLASLGWEPAWQLCRRRLRSPLAGLSPALFEDGGGEACVRAAIAAGRALREPGEVAKIEAVERWLIESASPSDLASEDFRDQAEQTLIRAKNHLGKMLMPELASDLVPWLLGSGDPLRERVAD